MSLGCGEWGLCLGLGRVGEDYESPGDAANLLI